MGKLAKIEYFINPEKKMVVGRADKNFCDTVHYELNERVPGRLKYFGFMATSAIDDIYLFGNNYYEAKAVARDEDEFDEKTGKSIVAKKLNYKYHRAMMRRYQVLTRQLKDLLNTINKLEMEHHAEMCKCDEALKKYE